MTNVTIQTVPVQILSLKDEDVLVVLVPVEEASEENKFHIARGFRNALSEICKSNPVIVVPNNMSLAVLRNKK